MKRPFSEIAIVFLATVMIFSCQQKARKARHQQAAKINDTITQPCAVEIEPTIAQIDKMKKAGDLAKFYIASDDNVFYMGTATEYLDSVKTKVIAKDSKGILIFKTQSGSIYKYNLSKMYWKILLFNGKDTPLDADITNFQDDYKKYMK